MCTTSCTICSNSARMESSSWRHSLLLRQRDPRCSWRSRDEWMYSTAPPRPGILTPQRAGRSLERGNSSYVSLRSYAVSLAISIVRTSSYSLVGGGIERPSFASSLSSQSRSASISYQETFYSRARETKVSLLIPHRRRDNASQRLASSPHKAAPPTRSVRAFRQHSAVLAAS